VRRRISLVMVRMCRTASTILPDPASPLVRIIAAPSQCDATLHPDCALRDKGTLKSCFQTWFSSSREQHFAFVDEVHFERFEHGRFGEMTNAHFGHHRMLTVFMISRIFSAEAIRATPLPCGMSEGTRSESMTAPRSGVSAMRACSALVHP